MTVRNYNTRNQFKRSLSIPVRHLVDKLRARHEADAVHMLCDVLWAVPAVLVVDKVHKNFKNWAKKFRIGSKAFVG